MRRGAYLREQSAQDNPEFVPIPGRNPYTGETELSHLEGYDQPVPTNCTIEEFRVIVHALKSHHDMTNLVNATRVLMHAKGQIVENAELETVPKALSTTDPSSNRDPNHPIWPSQVENVTEQSVMVLDHPTVVGQYPIRTNSRTVVNADMIIYPELDYVEVASRLYNDGRMNDTGTRRTQLLPSADWTLMDPTPAWAKNYDIYRSNLDLRSF